MKTTEKIYSTFAVLFLIALICVLAFYPETRQLKILLPVSFVGLMVNTIFMFIVLRDIFLRDFRTKGQKFLWVILILLVWPTVLVYLARFGFKPRNTIV